MDWSSLLVNAAKLGAAFLLALPIGWDREQEARSVGVRTFPLVAMASCGFLLMSRGVIEGSPEAHSKVIEGIITGVGFLGGGAIVKSGTSVHGTATAAAIWATAAVGAAVAYARYEVALLLSFASLVTLRWLKPLKRVAQENGEPRAQDQA